MADEVITTYWLTEGGDIATHVIYKDEAGRVYGESGDPAPAGTELNSSQIADILRRRVTADAIAHEVNQEAIQARYVASVEERDAKIATLIDSGISPEAADIIVPPLGGPPSSRPYVPHYTAEAGARSFGLSDVQVRQVLSARD